MTGSKNRVPPQSAALVRGGAQLSVDAVEGVTNIVEGMYRNIAGLSPLVGKEPEGGAPGIAGFVHRCVRGVNRGVGTSLDAALSLLPDSAALSGPASPEQDALIAALNGVLGDHLQASDNPLAIPMQFRVDGNAVNLDDIGRAVPAPSDTLLLSLHGLCMNDRQWVRDGRSHPRAAADLLGASAIDLYYNTGCGIADNGAELAGLLQKLTDAWPLPLRRIILMGHSMGGLVSRSAIHRAEQDALTWRGLLTDLVCIGSPHTGAPMERGGNLFNSTALMSPYTAPLARLGWLRSTGITDLRHGTVLPDSPRGAARFLDRNARPGILPLPAGVRCSAVAATVSHDAGSIKDRLLGDGLVPLESALGHADTPGSTLKFEPERTLVMTELNHWGLLFDRRVRSFVCAQLVASS